jgi:hypothetical protein
MPPHKSYRWNWTTAKKRKMGKRKKSFTSADVIETFFFPTALVETFSSSMKRERQIAFSNKSQAKSGMMMSR